MLTTVLRKDHSSPGLDKKGVLTGLSDGIYDEARYPHSFLGQRMEAPAFPCFSTKYGEPH